MRLILLFIFVYLTLTLYSQDNKSHRIDCYYIPWIIEPQWEFTEADIRSCKRNSYFSTNSNVLIDSLLYFLDKDKLDTAKNNHTLKIRMVIDYYKNDSLVNTILIGKPYFATQKYKYTKEDVKPPAFFLDGLVVFALLPIKMDDKIYRSNFEFGKFIFKNIPKANEW